MARVWICTVNFFSFWKHFFRPKCCLPAPWKDISGSRGRSLNGGRRRSVWWLWTFYVRLVKLFCPDLVEHLSNAFNIHTFNCWLPPCLLIIILFCVCRFGDSRSVVSLMHFWQVQSGRVEDLPVWSHTEGKRKAKKRGFRLWASQQ